jgi:adenylate cyclase
VAGLDAFLTRRLGTFLLAGKSRPIGVHELVCPMAEATPRQRHSATLFADGLAAYEAGAWHHAARAFGALLHECGDDGAGRFYLDACERFRTQPPADGWDGVVRLDVK